MRKSTHLKKLVILTGPQGSGNHLWSKIFSLHEDVFGWKSLLNNYWEAHRISEPFADCWKNTELLKDFDWDQSDYFFTSISVPLGIKGQGTKWCPNVPAFAQAAEDLGIDVEILVIGRDQNILNHQQTRLREESTVRHFLDQLPHMGNVTYLSYELLYLYKQEYLKSLKLNIPVAWYDDRVDVILEQDANSKYITYVDENPLDDCNKTGVPAPLNPFKEGPTGPQPEKPVKCC